MSKIQYVVKSLKVDCGILAGSIFAELDLLSCWAKQIQTWLTDLPSLKGIRVKYIFWINQTAVYDSF